MSTSILTLEHEFAIIKCMLTYDQHPLAMLGMRQHFKDYQLDPSAPDAFFLGEVEDDKIKRMFNVTIRGNETVIKKPVGNVSAEDFKEALIYCRDNAIKNNYKRIIHTILPIDLSGILIDRSILAQHFNFTNFDIPAGTRMKNKNHWLNVMNRSVFSYDTIFTTLEF